MEAPIPKGLDPTVWQALTYLFGLLLFTIIVWLITRFVNAVDQLAKTVATLILQVNSIQGEVDNMKADVTKVKKRFIAGPTDWDQP